MKNKLALCLTALLLSQGSALAEVLSPENALQRALSPSPGADPQHATAQALKGRRLTHVMSVAPEGTATPMVYVFNAAEGGYMVVSASDRTLPVLGYTDSGSVDPANMPPAMDWWLGEYARQIELKESAPQRTTMRFRLNRKSQPVSEIGPLVKTKWDQSEPYNDLSPLDVTGEKSYAGCVATAMAQVMNYHNWPVRGTGSHSYNIDGFPAMSFDFGSTTFDWSNMLDEYTAGNYNAAQLKAVNTLLLACGVSVDMKYSSMGSGATDGSVAKALWKYFGYSPKMRLMYRDYCNREQWDNILQTELAEGRPMVYAGSNVAGGHAFVCDGVRPGDNDPFYHINWGWSGECDGWFLIDVLYPDDSDYVDVTMLGYNMHMSVLTGIEKDTTDDSEGVPALVYISGFEMTLDSEGDSATLPARVKVIRSATNDIDATTTGVISRCTPGLSITPVNGGATIYAEGPVMTDIAVDASFKNWTAEIPQLEDGSYIVRPVVADKNGKWYDCMVYNVAPMFATINVEGGKMNVVTAEPAKIEAQNIEFHSKLKLLEPFNLSFRFSNEGDDEWRGQIYTIICNDDTRVIMSGNTYDCFFPAHEYSDILDEEQTLMPVDWNTLPEGGDYIFAFAIMSQDGLSMDAICPPHPVNVIANNDVPADFTIDSFEFVGDPSHADMGNLHFKGSITNNGIYMASGLYFEIYKYTGQTGGNSGADGTHTTPYVYFNNEYSWQTPYVWAWNESEPSVCRNRNWPGDPMTLVNGKWCWETPEGAVPTKIIFSNNGAMQTADLDFVNGATYGMNGPVDSGSGSTDDRDEVLWAFRTKSLYLDKGESRDFDTYVEFENGKIGETYIAVPIVEPIYWEFSDGKKPLYDNGIVFTVTEHNPSSITAIPAADTQVVDTQWFDLTGTPVSPDNRKSGIYVVRTTMSDGTVKVEKVAL